MSFAPELCKDLGVSQEKISRSSLYIIFLLSASLSFPWIGRYFYTRGEPREALVAQAMLMTGNWISPPAYAGVVPSKPPFLHWLISLCSLPFGEVTEATSRLPTALAIILFSLGFYRFVARRFNANTAMLSSLILLSSAEWFRASSSARVDTLLAASFVGALLSLFSWEESGRKGVPWLALLLCICATLTKGPVGIVLPLGIFALYRIVKGGFNVRNLFLIGRDSVCLAIPIIVVAASWYVAAYMERGDEFLRRVWYENFERLSSSMEDEPHKHSAGWLLGTLVLGTLPWSLVCIALVMFLTKKRVPLFSSVRRWFVTCSEFERFSLIAACAVVAFFCIPSSKRSVYLLPAYPFMAFLGAIVLGRAAAVEVSCDGWADKIVRGITGCSRRLCSIWIWLPVWVVGVVVYTMGAEHLPPQQRFMLQSFGRAYLAPWTVGTLAVFSLLAFRRWSQEGIKGLLQDRHCAMGWWLIVLVGVVNWFIVDPFVILLSPRDWVATKRFHDALGEAHGPLYSYGTAQYAISFYLKQRISLLDANAPSGSLVFIEPRDEASMREQFPRTFTLVTDNQEFLSPLKRNLLLKEVRVYRVQ